MYIMLIANMMRRLILHDLEFAGIAMCWQLTYFTLMVFIDSDV